MKDFEITPKNRLRKAVPVGVVAARIIAELRENGARKDAVNEEGDRPEGDCDSDDLVPRHGQGSPRTWIIAPSPAKSRGSAVTSSAAM
jgi:hypothetical protein